MASLEEAETDQYSAAVSMMFTPRALLAIDQDAAGEKFMFQPLRPAQLDSAGSSGGTSPQERGLQPLLALLNSTAESAKLTTRAATVVSFGPVQLNRV